LFYQFLFFLSVFVLCIYSVQAEELAPKNDNSVQSGSEESKIVNKTETITDDSKTESDREETVDKEAPQILTSDLARKQDVDGKRMTASFVIVDSSTIKSILIDGEIQSFEPADTVEITKELVFQPGINKIEITATDILGNERTRSYVVFYRKEKPVPLLGTLTLAHRTVQVNNESPDETILKVAEKGADGKTRLKTIKVPWGKKAPEIFQWVALLDLGYGQDSNPTNDMSSPFDIGDIEVQGVVDDAEQSDTVTSAKAIVAMNFSSLSWFLGASGSTYGKESNKGLNSQVSFVGIGLKSNTFRKRFLKTGRRLDLTSDPDGVWWKEQGNYWLLNLLITDINVGNENYALNYTLSPGMQFEVKSNRGSSSFIVGMDIIYKDFASETKEDGAQGAMKFEYKKKNENKLDGYHFGMSAGNSVEGSQESTYQFIGFDSGLVRQWDSGFVWNIGGGLQMRNYPYDLPISDSTGLGSKRADIPIKLANTIGLRFWKRWTLKHDFKYTFSYSNKSPYERMTNMLSLNAWL